MKSNCLDFLSYIKCSKFTSLNFPTAKWSFFNTPGLEWLCPVKAPLSEPQLQEFANKSVSSILLYSTTVNCSITKKKKRKKKRKAPVAQKLALLPLPGLELPGRPTTGEKCHCSSHMFIY